MRRILLVLLAAALNLQSADTTNLGMDSDRLARISTRMKEFVQEGRIAGAVMLVARRDGFAFSDAVGYRDIEMRKPMRTDTIFRVASITKPVTAIGLMMLQEEGSLLISSRLDRHVPEFKGLRLRDGAEPSRPVTIHDLMTHTSGMAHHPDGPDGAPSKRLAEAVEKYAQSPLEFEPGTKFLYSSAGFETLGRIIEVVSGRSYETFLEERIFGPLGMKDSSFFLSPEKRDRLAQLQEGELRRLFHDSSEEGRGFPNPAGGLFSTAADLGVLLQMMLNRGTYDGQRLLSPASVEAMTTNQIPEELGRKWGLGWRVASRSGRIGGWLREWENRLPALGSARAFGHGGVTGVSVWVDPGRDLARVFLIHQTDSEASYVKNVFRVMAYAAVVD